MKNKIKKRFEKDYYLIFLNKNKYFILSIIIGILLYSLIHELMHYFVARHFMYAAEFCWTCFPIGIKYLLPMSEILKSHYFLISMAPYLLSTILLIILYVLFLVLKNTKIVLLSIIPFFNVIANVIIIPLAYFTKTSNDFLNLFKAGFYWEVVLLILTPVFLFYLIILNYKREILNL